MSALMHIDLPIARWAFWGEGLPAEAPTDGRGEPDVSFVDPLLRRRLSRLARMALCVAHACRQGEAAVRFVFASRHGDLNRTHRLLVALADDEPLSPTAFSLSVLNAVPGLHGILNADRSTATAVSAGEDTLAQALIEAAGQWAEDPNLPVLMVYADEPVPECYRPFVGAEPPAHALGLLLREGEDSARCRLERDSGPGSAVPAVTLARALREGGTARWPGWGFRHV